MIEFDNFSSFTTLKTNDSINIDNKLSIKRHEAPNPAESEPNGRLTMDDIGVHYW